MTGPAAFRAAIDQFADRRWRLNNLYYITDKEGRRVRFEMNAAQLALFAGMHTQNVILKARQRGFTTFIQLFMLDACVFNSDIRAGTIAHTLADAQVIFRDKVGFPTTICPTASRPRAGGQRQRQRAPAVQQFRHPRRHVAALRHAAISARLRIRQDLRQVFRQGARGAHRRAQHRGQGSDRVRREHRRGPGRPLLRAVPGRAEPRQYRRGVDADGFQVSLLAMARRPPLHPRSGERGNPPSFDAYFAKLARLGIALTPAQRAWYVKKAEQQQGDMTREFPSTPDEAFEAAIEGAYYSEQLMRMELDRRLTPIPIDPAIPVLTAWDLGFNDANTIWFIQFAGLEIRFVDYYEASGHGLEHYVGELKARRERHGYTFGEHFFPHDVNTSELSNGRSRFDTLVGLGVVPTPVPRVRNINDGINAARRLFARAVIDPVRCERGLRALRNYRREWDEERATFRDRPLHNWASTAPTRSAPSRRASSSVRWPARAAATAGARPAADRGNRREANPKSGSCRPV